MHLNVIDMPEHWPDGTADGSVHSVYAGVLNLSFDDGDHLALDARGGSDTLPGTARIGEAPGLDFRRLVTPGAPVSLRAGVLRVQGSPLTADFRTASRNRPSSEPMEFADGSPDNASWFAAWNLFLVARSVAGFAIALNHDAATSRLDGAIARRVRATVSELLRTASTGNVEFSRTCLARLIGAGPGLTPSGDDFTTGFLLGLRCGSASQRRFAERLADDCRRLSQASTDISRHYLGHAAAGRFAGSSIKFARAVLDGADDTEKRLRTVLGAGASSGSDTAFGILCGLAVSSEELTDLVVNALLGSRQTTGVSA